MKELITSDFLIRVKHPCRSFFLMSRPMDVLCSTEGEIRVGGDMEKADKRELDRIGICILTGIDRICRIRKAVSP